MSDIANNGRIESKVEAKALSDNTLNAGLVNTGDVALNFSGKGAANVIGTLAIARHPEKLAELRATNARGITRAYRKYREAIPWLTDQQAFFLAMGTPVTPNQASNLFEIFDTAAKILETRGAEPHEPPEAKASKCLKELKTLKTGRMINGRN